MRKLILVAGLSAAALIPSFATAQASCEQQRDNRVVGTVAGAGIGALLGSAIAGRGERTTGAVVGGIGGAIVGNQLSKPNADCTHAYGYYDGGGQWHANAIQRSDATGYYDRDGAWVDGAPNGYYDAKSRWVASNDSSSASGYYDGRGRWIPASAGGYYDTDGQWVGGTASGYYQNGRWVAGPATGRYDADGRWIAGAASGHRDSSGVWVADAQPGHYDSDGRWRAGPSVGYYDAQGRWIATALSAESHGADVSYQRNDRWAGAPTDIDARVTWLDQRIRDGMSDGSLSRYDARQALSSLDQIRRQESGLRRGNGGLSDRDQAFLQAKLDDLSRGLRWTRADSEDGIY